MDRALDDIIKENNKGLRNFRRGRGNRRDNNRNGPNQRRQFEQRDNFRPRRDNFRQRRDNFRPRQDNFRPRRNDRMIIDRELTPRYERNNRQNKREYGFNTGMSKVSKIEIILYILEIR